MSEASSIGSKLPAFNLNSAVTPNVTQISSVSKKRKLCESRKNMGVRVRMGLEYSAEYF